MSQLVYTMFVTNNHTSFHLWWKENLLNHQNVPKYYENNCRLHTILGRTWCRDKSNLTPATKFSYLKDFDLIVKILIDGLPFFFNSYNLAKSILKTKFGQSSKIANVCYQGKRKCFYFGNEDHKLFNCYKVKSISQRCNILAANGLCYECLGKKHKSIDCKKKRLYKNCNSRHHTWTCGY